MKIYEECAYINRGHDTYQKEVLKWDSIKKKSLNEILPAATFEVEHAPETDKARSVGVNIFSCFPNRRLSEGTKLLLNTTDSKSASKFTEPFWRAIGFLTLTHLPWQVVRLADTLTALVRLADTLTAPEPNLVFPLKEWDQGKGGRPVRWGADLPMRGSAQIFVVVLLASESNKSKFFGRGSARRSKTSYGVYRGESAMLDFLIFS